MLLKPFKHFFLRHNLSQNYKSFICLSAFLVDVLHGPFGGSLTSWSDENLSKDFGSITRVQITSGDIIDAIRFQYGATWGPWHGNFGAESETIELNSEKIIKIQGTGSSNHFWFGSVIATIEFHTNQGRKFGPYGKGGTGMDPWVIEREQCSLTWIAGDSNSHVESMSFNFQCSPEGKYKAHKSQIENSLVNNPIMKLKTVACPRPPGCWGGVVSASLPINTAVVVMTTSHRFGERITKNWEPRGFVELALAVL